MIAEIAKAFAVALCSAPRRLAVAALTIATLTGAPVSAQALSTDPRIEGAKLCTKQFPRFEREYGIPVHLLAAISATESGRYHEGLKISLPWPWTINVEGKGYYYETKQEAIAAVKKFQAQGAKSIDIGCMQVNLKHHPNAFSNLENAFEPEKNVAYAASFLRSLYEETKSWKEAAADYHSRTPSFGRQYVGQVYDRWYNIIDRVRSARVNMAKSAGGVVAGQGLTKAEAFAANEASAVTNKAPLGAGTPIPPGSRMRSLSLNDDGVKSTSSIPRGVSSKIIQVKNASSERPPVIQGKKENGVSVVRPPQPALIPVVSSAPIMPKMEPAVALAAVSPSAGPSTVPAAHVIQGSPPAHQAGPRFIFND